jgi:DNA-binding GntR family transcriptional regulator
MYGVGAHTVDRAVDVLREEGLLQTVRGKGFFVKRLWLRCYASSEWTD